MDLVCLDYRNVESKLDYFHSKLIFKAFLTCLNTYKKALLKMYEHYWPSTIA